MRASGLVKTRRYCVLCSARTIRLCNSSSVSLLYL